MAARKRKKAAPKPAAPQETAIPELHSVPSAIEHPHYNVAFEYAVDCQIVTDRSGVILNVNHVGTRVLGTEKQFLIGKPLGLLFGSNRRTFYDHLVGFGPTVQSCAFEATLSIPHSAPRAVLVMGVLEGRELTRWIIHDLAYWQEAEEARIHLLRRFIHSEAEERRKLSRDLHDNIGQLLTGLTLALGGIDRAAELTGNSREALALAREISRELHMAVRNISHGLRLSLLDEATLGAALQHLVSDWETRQPEIVVQFAVPMPEEIRLPREVESAIYSIVQEALTNVYRHAGASRVVIVVERGKNQVVAVVEDDGAGFDPNLVSHQTGIGRLGLVGMRERATLVGGEIKIDTKPGSGTRVSARIPVPTNNVRSA